jgi:hypothetical protein
MIIRDGGTKAKLKTRKPIPMRRMTREKSIIKSVPRMRRW